MAPNVLPLVRTISCGVTNPSRLIARAQSPVESATVGNRIPSRSTNLSWSEADSGGKSTTATTLYVREESIAFSRSIRSAERPQSGARKATNTVLCPTVSYSFASSANDTSASRTRAAVRSAVTLVQVKSTANLRTLCEKLPVAFKAPSVGLLLCRESYISYCGRIVV